LERAELERAELERAELERADLERAELDGAESDETDLAGREGPDVREPGGAPEFARLRTRYWSVLFLLHVVAAFGWWWVMPGGFPVSHPRFWVNSVLPWVVMVTAIAGVRAIHRRQSGPTAVLTTVAAVFWMTIVVAGCVVFPITARGRLFSGLLVLLAAAGARIGLAPAWSRSRRAELGGAAAAIAAALLVVFSQRGPAPSTHPSDVRINDFGPDRNVDKGIVLIQRGDRVQILPGDGSASFAAGNALVEVKPLVHFESRSPDRCWTILAPPAARRPLPLREVGRKWEDKLVRIRYYEPAQTLSVDTSEPDSCLLEGVTQLDEPVYSHLNSFSEVRVEGHGGELSLTFSPCGDVTFTVPSSDYPVGRPVRFAYLGADGLFRVVEATSAEKGPFTTLAEGPLARDEALVIGIRVNGKRAARVTFLDFAAQASTELSPTAGWGVPQNSIEMRRLGEIRAAPVQLWLTLAGTSVGRGFDSVGYAAGTYRNRVKIEIDQEEKTE
jgi:hypothetical protein